MGIGDTWNMVQRQNFAADEVDEVLAEVRELVQARGRRNVQWEIGSTARPPGLVDMLLERGLVPHEHDDYAVALVLRSAPPPGPAEMTGPPGVVPRGVHRGVRRAAHRLRNDSRTGRRGREAPGGAVARPAPG